MKSLCVKMLDGENHINAGEAWLARRNIGPALQQHRDILKLKACQAAKARVSRE